MRTYSPIAAATVQAAEAITKQLFVNFAGAICGAGEKALGVSPLDYDSGEQAGIDMEGIVLVKTGGAITAGDAVTSDADGKAVAATAFSVSVPAGSTAVESDAAQPDLVESGSVLPEAINGYALDTATGPDELIRVKLV